MGGWGKGAEFEKVVPPEERRPAGGVREETVIAVDLDVMSHEEKVRELITLATFMAQRNAPQAMNYLVSAYVSMFIANLPPGPYLVRWAASVRFQAKISKMIKRILQGRDPN
jgi:hypothetical protein